MQIPVNKDLDSYRDDFFKGLTLKQTVLSITAVAAGTAAFLLGRYAFGLSESVCFYLALPVVFPVAASGFLKIHGMAPAEYIRRRRSAGEGTVFYYIPGALLDEEEKNAGKDRKKVFFLLDEEADDSHGCDPVDVAAESSSMAIK